MSDPEDDLFGVLRAGQAPRHYPRIRSLLTSLDGADDADDADLARAGRLLARLDPDEVLAAHPATATLRIAVTGHGTLSPLVPALTVQAARHGLLLRPHVAPFDSWVFELSDPNSALYAADADATLCVLDPHVVFDEVPVPWGPAEVEAVLAEKVAIIERLVKTFVAAERGGVLVLNTLPLPRRATAQLVDLRSRAELGALWREANARLLRLSGPSVAVVDLDPLLAEGVRATDARTSAYAKDHLSAELLAAYAREVVHLARTSLGRTKKALVVDLDETLWGGVLGDDGVDGIEIGHGYRGEAFAAFQRVVKQIGSQGVVLAVVSKNEAEPVARALSEREGMVLREEDFVRVTANWRPKDENLAELAAALNLGVDSFVFADDSAFECGLVSRSLPEVAVVRLDAEPALHIDKLLADGWFDVRELTAEDRARTARYRDEVVRADFRAGFGSVQDYLAELDISVELAVPSDRELARVAQLTLRTNQFNLTTHRLRHDEVAARITDPDALVLRIAAADRFGENGLVGALFARWEQEQGHGQEQGRGQEQGQVPGQDRVLRIENMLLSCRVFSRGIEQACLSALAQHAREAGASAVVGEYRPTAKNVIVRDLYANNGFAATDEEHLFRHDLRDIAPVPSHLRLTTTLSGVRP
jgi:FkbH-like protein